MKSDKQINKILLMALSEPEYARPDYWIAQHKNTIYSREVFIRKLIDAYRHYIKRIDDDEYEVKIANPDAEISCSIPLVYETDFELIGHLSRNDLYSLFNSLNELAELWLPTENTTEKEIKYTQPIKWLKSEDSLRQLIDALKEKGFIQIRDTEDIIQHFSVYGRETKETQSELIRWEHEIRYLAYLIHQLGAELLISIKDSKHKLTVSHFVDKNGKELKENSLSSSLSTLQKNGRDKTIQCIDAIINGLSHN